MNNYSELKRLAEAASVESQGVAWAYEPHGDTGEYGVGVLVNEHGNYVEGRQGSCEMSVVVPVAPEVSSEVFAAFIASANPSAVLALIAEVEDLRKGRTDWQAECLKRGFEYVRESDDHYVLADTPEMAELLGLLLGVEVRSKDNDSYGETVSMLQDMADANSDAFHRAYELEKENESLKKDAARYRWLRDSKRFDDEDPLGQLACGETEGEDLLFDSDLDHAIDMYMVWIKDKDIK